MTMQAHNQPYETARTDANKRSLLAGCFMLLFLAAFILVGAAAIFAANAEFLLFRKAVYLQVFEEKGLFERFPELISDPLGGQIETEAEGGQLSEELPDRGAFQYLDREDYQVIISSLVTPDWVREQASRLLDQGLAYLNLETPTLNAVISTAEIRERLQGETGQGILQRIMDSWPPCTTSQLLEMASTGLNGSLENFPVCLPPAEYIPMVTPFLQDGLEQMAADIPDEVDLLHQSPAERGGAPSEQEVDPLRLQQGQAYRILRWSIRLAPLAALGILALLTLVAVRSWRDTALWWGLGLAGAGVLALVTSLILGLPLATRLLEQAFGVEISGSLQSLVQLVMETGRTILERYFYWAGVEAAILALVGIALVVISQLLPRGK